MGRGLSPPPDRLDRGVALLHGEAPLSGWANLGLWQPQSAYPVAAATLARAVGEAAALGPTDRVLELACGAGAGLSLWRDRFGVQALTGIEPDPCRAARARGQGATLIEAPALHAGGHLAAHGPFDAIVCVDAAYHLGSLEALLPAASAALAPGGRLACTTLCLDRPPGPVEAPALRIFQRLASIPAGAILTRPALAASARGAGLEGLDLQDLSRPVLLGFAAAVRRLGRTLPPSRRLSPAYLQLALTARAATALVRRGLGSYLLVSARAPSRH